MNEFVFDNNNNNCKVDDERIKLIGYIKGINNSVIIEKSSGGSSINLAINGNNNSIKIEGNHRIKELKICIGNHVEANDVLLSIGPGFSNEGAGVILLYNSGSKFIIGNNCMFSNNIVVRCGESPHLIFDSKTGEYLDTSDGVFIGDHVWIGERVYITKNVTIPSECVVGACSVVTRRFDKLNCAIAGNPAKVVRENVQWIRNASLLKNGSIYKENYDLWMKR